MDDTTQQKVELLADYIMKNCLWQFHSRTWDRERQNKGVLTKTMQLLCDEPVDKKTPEDRCYLADAICLAAAYKKLYPWINTMDEKELKALMHALKERIDYLTITGSLNEELTVPLY